MQLTLLQPVRAHGNLAVHLFRPLCNVLGHSLLSRLGDVPQAPLSYLSVPLICLALARRFEGIKREIRKTRALHRHLIAYGTM